MKPLTLSSRLPTDGPNELALARLARKTKGVVITDLTDSNPTKHGLIDPAIFDVLARHLTDARRYVPNPRGWPSARAALAERFGGRPQDYWLTASTSEAYGWLFALFVDPGDAIAAPAPGYPLVEPLAQLAGVRPVPYSAFYMHPHGWELDLDAIRRMLASTDAPMTAPDVAMYGHQGTVAQHCLTTGGVRAMVVVNPNNPTGAYLHPGPAKALGAACAEAGVPIIADEVFFPFTLDDQASNSGTESAPGVASHHHPPSPAPARMADAAGPDAVVITLDGLSKLLAAPQLKLGWIRLSGPRKLTAPLAEALDTVADTYLSVNSPVACALPDLLGLADASIERIRQRCSTNYAALRDLGGGYRRRHTEGGWTALVDVPPLMDDDTLSRHLLTDGLTAHPGWFYDLAGSGSLALSLLPEPAVFADGVARLQRSLARK